MKENSLTKQLSIPNVLPNLNKHVLMLQKTLQPRASDSAEELLGVIGSLKEMLMSLTFTHKYINNHDLK